MYLRLFHLAQSKNKSDITLFSPNQFINIFNFFRYCIFIDNENTFYLTNLKTNIINVINLDDDSRTGNIFGVKFKKYQEQFIFGDQQWLDGFKLSSYNFFETNGVAMLFYTDKLNEIFVTNWKNSLD